MSGQYIRCLPCLPRHAMSVCFVGVSLSLPPAALERSSANTSSDSCLFALALPLPACHVIFFHVLSLRMTAKTGGFSGLLSTFRKISESPTNPHEPKPRKTFDVADLYRGPVAESVDGESAATALDEKLRQAYFWIVNHAIISPFYDIEYYEEASQSFTLGDQKSKITLPSGQSYSSFVLLPILNLAIRKRCLIVGGPGRGKTASAILMGLLAGYPLREIKRAIQHGQPQMTIADLFGNPLPADLLEARSMEKITIAWRKWLGMRVKIIDEYNRIPTRTQSALLTVMGDNYAEMLG